MHDMHGWCPDPKLGKRVVGGHNSCMSVPVTHLSRLINGLSLKPRHGLRLVCQVGIVAICLGTAPWARAETAHASVGVSAIVLGGCSVTTQPSGHARIPGSAKGDVPGAVSVNCPPGVSYSVTHREEAVSADRFATLEGSGDMEQLVMLTF